MLDINKWLKVLDYKNLESFFRSEKDKGTIKETVGRVVVSWLIYSIPIIILQLVLLTDGTSFSLITSIIGVVIAFVIFAILIVISFFICNGTQHLIALALGGKGSYSGLLHLTSFILAIAFLVLLPLEGVAEISSLVPAVATVVNCLFSIVFFGLIFYALYASYLAVKMHYNMTPGRAAAAVILDALLWLVVLVVIFIVMAAAIGPMISTTGGLNQTG